MMPFTHYLKVHFFTNNGCLVSQKCVCKISLFKDVLNFFLQILNTVKSILEGYENFAHLIP